MPQGAWLTALLRHWRLIALTAALAGLIYAIWLVVDTFARVEALQATVADLRADLAEAERSAKIVRDFHREKDMIDDALDAKALAIAKMEGGDAPLSDYLRAAAGQLWP